MKSIIKLLILLIGLYCVVMLATSTWLMFSIYGAYRDYYSSDFESLYGAYHLAIAFCFSVVFLVLQGFIVFRGGRVGVVLVGLMYFLVVILIFYFAAAYSASRSESAIFQEILYSSTLYLILNIASSVLAGFWVWCGYER